MDINADTTDIDTDTINIVSVFLSHTESAIGNTAMDESIHAVTIIHSIVVFIGIVAGNHGAFSVGTQNT